VQLRYTDGTGRREGTAAAVFRGAVARQRSDGIERGKLRNRPRLLGSSDGHALHSHRLPGDPPISPEHQPGLPPKIRD